MKISTVEVIVLFDYIKYIKRTCVPQFISKIENIMTPVTCFWKSEHVLEWHRKSYS